MYNRRIWLNKKDSPSTGSLVCFDGNTTWHGENIRNTFLQVSDCNWSVRLHKTEDDDTANFIDKMKLLRDEVDKFISYLEENK